MLWNYFRNLGKVSPTASSFAKATADKAQLIYPSKLAERSGTLKLKGKFQKIKSLLLSVIPAKAGIHASLMMTRNRLPHPSLRSVLAMTLLFSMILNSLFIIPTFVYAASSPWAQTDWVGGSGQTSWSDTTKYSSGSSVTTSTANQVTLTNTEKFSNTGFETDLSSWNTGAQPDSISGLKLWLKADAITGLSDGNSVTTWTDSSGNSNNATQSTDANKPTYKTNILNSQPVVRFDGTNDVLQTASSVLGGATDFTAFVVIDYITLQNWPGPLGP